MNLFCVKGSIFGNRAVIGRANRPIFATSKYVNVLMPVEIRPSENACDMFDFEHTLFCATRLSIVAAMYDIIGMTISCRRDVKIPVVAKMRPRPTANA